MSTVALRENIIMSDPLGTALRFFNVTSDQAPIDFSFPELLGHPIYIKRFFGFEVHGDRKTPGTNGCRSFTTLFTCPFEAVFPRSFTVPNFIGPR